MPPLLLEAEGGRDARRLELFPHSRHTRLQDEDGDGDGEHFHPVLEGLDGVMPFMPPRGDVEVMTAPTTTTPTQ